MTPDMREWALWYATRGFRVLPLHEPVGSGCSCGKTDCKKGKHPRTAHGCLDATRNREQIAQWWKQWPTANIGIATGPGSDLLVLDGDPRSGGPDSLSAVSEALGQPLPGTAVVTTGSGGIHVYYRSSGGACQTQLATGLDVKRAGGYVVAPPSLHASGSRYEWDGANDREALVEELTDAPAWLEERVKPAATAAAAKAEVTEKWPAGERNNRMTSLAGTLRRKGLPEAVILGALQAANKLHCDGALPDSEVRHIAGSVARYEPGEVAAESVTEWRTPEPLGTPDPGDLELSMFPPGFFKNMVEAVAANTETPYGLPGMVGLGAVSGSIAGKVRVKPFEGDYYEHVNLYIAVVLPPANRKSGVFERLGRPIVAFEEKLQADMGPLIDRLQSARRTDEAEIDRLRRAKGQVAGATQDKQRLIDELERNMPTVPVLPELTCADVTPEALALHLQEQGERAILMSAEGGVFDAVTGTRWAGAANLDLICQAHSQDAVKIKRKNKDSPPISLKHPCLTIVVCTQPHIVLKMNDKEGFRGQGVMGRFLYLFPPSKIGHRRMKSTIIPPDVSAAWNNAITKLLEMMPEEPFTLTLTDDARAVWHEFELEQDAAMLEGDGEQDTITDWAGKLPAAALRVAACFHCCLHLDKTPDRTEIQRGTIQAAVNLCRALVPHAFVALKVDERKPEMVRARKLLPWIKRQREFKTTDCQVANRRAASTKEELIEALECLENRGYLRKVGYERRDSTIWTVNPAVTEVE